MPKHKLYKNKTYRLDYNLASWEESHNDVTSHGGCVNIAPKQSHIVESEVEDETDNTIVYHKEGHEVTCFVDDATSIIKFTNDVARGCLKLTTH